MGAGPLAASRDPGCTPLGPLARIVYELLDAHDDTMRLAAHPPDDQRWQAHLEYLRTLQRRGREILAHASQSPDATET